MGFITSFFGGKSKRTTPAAVSGLQLQSSTYGAGVQIVYGTTRIAPNLIWYGDFVATQQQSSAGGGGKGGVGGGGGGKGGGGSGSYIYQTAVALGLCEGPIHSIGNVYADKNITSLSSLGLTAFLGDYAQSPWGYLTTNHTDEALNYHGLAYVAASAYQLGNSPQLPNHNFEVYGAYSDSISGQMDADPSLVINDLLTNSHYGAGFPSDRVGDLSVYQQYTVASGLWISSAYNQQTQASAILDDLATATNSAFVWSNGVLTLVPYGDQDITANGYTYTAPAAPLYDLTDDDFLPNQGSSTSQDPVSLARKRPSDSLNNIKIECLDRTNNYNPAVIEAKDQALIDVFGLRASSSRQAHMFADLNAGRLSAQLQLQRQAIRNVYQFTLDQRYVLLDPMDIVTITDANLGLNKQWVRITEITEDDNGNLLFSAEEYLNGTGHAPLYTFQSGLGFNANYNAPSGDANAPIIFEPTAELAESLEVWMAVSGDSFWGGCDVSLSYDGDSYKNIGRVNGPCRTGKLTSVLPSYSKSEISQTIDQTNTLAIDLSESHGQLLSGSQIDATALTTLCYADGEYVAYQTATLTGTDTYNLTYLVRGAYGSTIGAHAIGSRFARLEDGIFKFPYTQDYIGKTVYIKLTSFNIYGGGEQSISDVEPYSYTLLGTAISSPLPVIENLRTSYIADITQLTWDAVTDFRPVLYEIRKGADWDGSQVLGRVAHPPFNAQGDGTYWVSAYAQPAPGLAVYSEYAVSISIQGSQITSNVIASYDEAATGWTGTFGGSAALTGSVVSTTGAGNILGLADYLNEPDILNFGGQGNGIYEIPTAHQIDVGRVVPCNVLISWTSIGQKINNNILTVDDYLNDSDILDAASSAYTNIFPEIALSQDGITWGSWQKYATGAYAARKFKARMQLQTLDPSIEAILEEFTFAVDVPDRDDHYINQSISNAGTALSWQPDGSGSPVPFNGGPSGSSTPNVQVTILSAQAGDLLSLTSITLSGATIRILNSGVGVARHVNVLAQGY